jgi:NADP-dependent 3-hydroxy acid dehydrogenase YdfG
LANTIVIAGFGPGTATAVAERFGREGFSVALVGRNEERVNAGVSTLTARGINAFAFNADVGDAAAIQATLRLVRSQIGPVTVLFWNAYGGADVGDLLGADPAALHRVFDAPVFGLLAAVDEALADLKSAKNGAVLISNGAFGTLSPETDEAATRYHAMGLALACAAKDKLAGLLAQRLKGDGVYVGEVVVYGTIKGTPSTNSDSIDPAVVADKHWDNYVSRAQTRAVVK